MIMLDSLPILASHEGRRPTIEKLGKFLQEMLKHESFYKYKTPFRPQISDYAFVDTLKTGEQASGSNDCGVWVATWMINFKKTNNYSISVDDITRMRLALDLIRMPHNQIAQDVIVAAIRNYDKYVKKR